MMLVLLICVPFLPGTLMEHSMAEETVRNPAGINLPLLHRTSAKTDSDRGSDRPPSPSRSG